MPLKDLRTAAKAAGFAPAILYRAREALKIDEYHIDHRKWWKLPLDAAGADRLSLVRPL